MVIVQEETQTLIINQPGAGGAVSSVNGRTGAVTVTAEDVGGDDLSGVDSPSTARTNIGLTSTPHQTIRVSTRTGSTDTRTGLGVYDASKPFASVQAALNASVSGDTIIVEPGTYTLSARLTGFSGRVLHLQGATLQGNITVSGVGDAMIRATSGQTLTITGTGTIRNTASAATINADSGSTARIEAAKIENTATSGAALVCGGTLVIARVGEILSSLYDCVIFTRGIAHVRAERIVCGASNCVSLECDTPGGTFFVDADYMIADEVFAEESAEAGTVYIHCRHVEASGGPLSPLDDGGLGTFNQWYIRADKLSGDLLSINANVIVVDAQFETLARRNAANGYAGLDGSSKLTGSQQVYGTGSNTACQGNDSRLSDSRTPTAHATSHQPGGSDAMAVDAAAATGSLRTLGTSATSACAGNDARLSDTRTPTDASVTLAKMVPFLSVFRDAPGRRCYRAWAARGDNTRLINPAGAGTYSGTISTTDLSASGHLQRATSAASINAVAGGLLWGTYGMVDRQMGPRFACRFRASADTTDLRQFVGLSDTQLGSTDTPTCEGAYFRYSTSAGDAGWVCVTNRGSSRTVSSSVRTFTASEVLLVAIDFDDTGTARFWMGTSEANMTIVHSATANLPFTSSAITACIGAGAVIAAGRAIDFGHAFILTS